MGEVKPFSLEKKLNLNYVDPFGYCKVRGNFLYLQNGLDVPIRARINSLMKNYLINHEHNVTVNTKNYLKFLIVSMEFIYYKIPVLR